MKILCILLKKGYKNVQSRNKKRSMKSVIIKQLFINLKTMNHGKSNKKNYVIGDTPDYVRSLCIDERSVGCPGQSLQVRGKPTGISYPIDEPDEFSILTKHRERNSKGDR